MCKIKRIYTDYECDLYKNMFNLVFLTKYYYNLYHYLDQLFKIKKHSTWFILSNKYYYVWKDWFDGKKYQVYLLEAITHKKEKNINKIKNNDFQIQLIKLNF